MTPKVTYTTNNNLGKLLETQKTQKSNKFDKNVLRAKKSVLDKLPTILRKISGALKKRK
jgi:hypothetical protein